MTIWSLTEIQTHSVFVLLLVGRIIDSKRVGNGSGYVIVSRVNIWGHQIQHTQELIKIDTKHVHPYYWNNFLLRTPASGPIRKHVTSHCNNIAVSSSRGAPSTDGSSPVGKSPCERRRYGNLLEIQKKHPFSGQLISWQIRSKEATWLNLVFPHFNLKNTSCWFSSILSVLSSAMRLCLCH